MDQDKQQETKKREISLTNQLQQLKDDEIHLKKNRERIKIKIDALNRSRYDVVLQSWKDQVPIRLTIGNYNNLFLPPTNTEDEDESNLLHQHRISKIAVCYNRLSEAQKNFTLEQRKQNEKNILTKIQNSEVRLKFRIKPNPEVFEILQDKAEQLNANLASKKQDLKTICERVQNTKQEFENVRQQRIQQFGEDVEAASEAIQAFFGIISRQDEHIQFIPDNSAEPYLRGVEVNMDLSIRPAGLLALHFTLNKTPIVVMDEVEAGLNKDDATRLFEWLTANRDDTQSQIVLTTKRGSVDHGQIYGIWTENGNSMVHLHSAN